jgi:molybdopterin-guanine dinucleotide biosynthesis protein A
MTGNPLQLPDVTGVVLAGGRSARFGSDKLAVELDGRRLLDHALAAVAAVTPAVVIVIAPGSTVVLPAGLPATFRVVHDPVAFGGPLVGLNAALAAVDTPVVVVAGGDMPRMVPAVLHRLAATIGPGRMAVSLEVPGRIHPLPMALDVGAARTAAGRVLERGGRSLRELLRELDGLSLPAPVWLALDPTAATITDIDRPSDLDGEGHGPAARNPSAER